MKLIDLIQELTNKKEIDDDILYLITELLNVNRSMTMYLLNQDSKKEQEEFLKKEINAYLNSHLPVQYYLGYSYFYSLKLFVNKDTLIPRFETEELVEKVLERLNNHKNYQILDLCAGSGAIGLALKKNLNNSQIYLAEISDGAILIEEKNKKNLNLDVKIVKSDLLNYFIENNLKFDVIVSNPPYISYDSKDVDPLVKNNEPALALYAAESGYEFYIRILKDIKKCLNDHFIIAFEHGYDQRDNLIKLIKKYLGEVKINCYDDLAGQHRIIIIEN